MLKRHFIHIILFSTFILASFGQVAPNQMIAKMGRGINLGNILSAPIEGNWAPALTETYLDDVKSIGFKTVRIPIDFYGTRTSGNTSAFSKLANTANNYNGSESDYTISSSYLNRIEEIINWSLERGLITILDFHGNQVKEEFLYTFSPKDKWSSYYTEPTSAKRVADNQKFRAIWKQIANKFKNYSDNLLFEVVNEPYFFMTDSEMDVLNTDIIKIIRDSGSKNVHRNIIITGGSKNAYEAPLQISDNVLTSDNYLIATFHYYKPREFTASSEESHSDYTWGSNDDKALIDNHFTTVNNWAISKDIPVLLGEFGADNANGIDYASNTYSSFGGPEDESRVAFHKYLAVKAIELGFAFTVWDAGDKSNKTVYKVSDRSWVTNVRNALLGKDCLQSEFIENADIECGHDNVWNLFLQTPAVAEKSNTNTSESRSSSNSLKVQVTSSGTSFNKVIVKNKEVDVSDLVGNTYRFSVYAKGLTTSQQFKIRIKSISTNNIVSYQSSTAFNTSDTNYSLQYFDYTITSDTEKLEFQILCGKKTGTYFFDDFFVKKLETLKNDNRFKQSLVKVFPNPAKNFLKIHSQKEVLGLLISNLQGKIISKYKAQKIIDTSEFANGMYFLKIFFKDSSIYNTKFLTQNN